MCHPPSTSIQSTHRSVSRHPTTQPAAWSHPATPNCKKQASGQTARAYRQVLTNGQVSMGRWLHAVHILPNPLKHGGHVQTWRARVDRHVQPHTVVACTYAAPCCTENDTPPKPEMFHRSSHDLDVGLNGRVMRLCIFPLLSLEVPPRRSAPSVVRVSVRGALELVHPSSLAAHHLGYTPDDRVIAGK